MKSRLLLGAWALFFAVAAQAQQTKKPITAEGGGVDDRGSTRVLYWNSNINGAAGQFAINYGRPVWRKTYEDKAKFDAMTKGKVWRFGSNFWTSLVTDLPLNIGGKDVAPGAYYLGLDRSADGSQWSLAFIDPAGVRAAHIDAFDIQKAKVAFLAPVAQGKPGALASKLTVTLSHPKDDIRNVTLKIAWGTLVLTAPIKVTVSE